MHPGKHGNLQTNLPVMANIWEIWKLIKYPGDISEILENNRYSYQVPIHSQLNFGIVQCLMYGMLNGSKTPKTAVVINR